MRNFMLSPPKLSILDRLPMDDIMKIRISKDSTLTV